MTVVSHEELENSLYTYKAKCVRVIDGDTVELMIDQGLNIYRHARVRLYGLDTPEIHGVKHDSEEYRKGMIVKGIVAEQILGKQLWIETHKDKTGKYGRYLATIWYYDADEEFVCLNDMLVNEGHAESKTY